MGDKFEVCVWCVKDMADGTEDWGWETVYRGESLEEALRISFEKKRELDCAIKVYWR